MQYCYQLKYKMRFYCNGYFCMYYVHLLQLLQLLILRNPLCAIFLITQFSGIFITK